MFAARGMRVGLGRWPQRRQLSTRMAELRSSMNVLGGEAAPPETLRTFELWHDAVSEMAEADRVSSETADAFSSRVDDHVIFSPPTYFKPWEGRDEFMCLIECVGEVFGPSFTYGRQFLSPDGREWALEVMAFFPRL